MARAFVLLVALSLSAASTLVPSNDDPPEPDACGEASESGATAVVLGHRGEPFTPIIDGDEIDIVGGVQGDEMIPIRFRVEGLDSECVSQDTDILAGPDRISFSEVGLQTYTDDGGGRVTMDHFMILLGNPSAGEQLTITTTVAGATASVFVNAP